MNGGQAEACHRYAAMFIKVPDTRLQPDCYNGYIFNVQGTKGACEKNMEEAFKYSLKVKTCLTVRTLKTI